MRCVQGMSVTAKTEQGLRRLTLRAHSRVTQVCHVIVRFHVLRVDVSLDLGFRVVIGVGRLTVQQEGLIRQLHFTTHTQFKVQSSFLLDVVVRLCPAIVHSFWIPNSCIFHIAKTGLLRCCLYTWELTFRLSAFAVGPSGRPQWQVNPCARRLLRSACKRVYASLPSRKKLQAGDTDVAVSRWRSVRGSPATASTTLGPVIRPWARSCLRATRLPPASRASFDNWAM